MYLYLGCGTLHLHLTDCPRSTATILLPSTTISTNTVVATDNISGIRTPITDVDSGFTVSRTVSATSQFVVFLKSDGVSQVLIGVSPN